MAFIERNIQNIRQELADAYNDRTTPPAILTSLEDELCIWRERQAYGYIGSPARVRSE